MTLLFQSPFFQRMRRYNASATLWNSTAPVREELFSAERLEQHACSLAQAQVVTQTPPKVVSLSRRLNENASVLLSAYRACAATLAEGRDIVPAAAWLLDNYHLIEAQIREIRGNLPPGYYRQLPKLADGPFAGYPRVFGIAWAFVAHTDSHLELTNLRAFLNAYQREQPLTIGELWAVAITLRIVLVENLRRLADQITEEQSARDEADALATKWIVRDSAIAESDSGKSDSGKNDAHPSSSSHPGLAVGQQADHEFPSFTLQKAPLSASFTAQLAKRLRGINPRTSALACWLSEQLHSQGESIDDVVQSAQHRQGAASVTMRNIITSMRFIASTDWADLLESVSLVDAKLSQHSQFAQYDFATRNQYRSAVEELARGSAYSELEVTDHALNACRDALATAKGATEAARVGDPGYVLVAGGRATLEKRLGFHPSLRRRFRQLLIKNGIPGYVALLAITTTALAALAGWLLWLTVPPQAVPIWWLLLLAGLSLLPLIEVATLIVNRFVIHSIGAEPLPSLDLSKGVPSALRTLVAVPTLLTNEADLKEQINRLEVHFLSSGDGAISYALLSDGVDAQCEELAHEAALFSIAEQHIQQLNDRYYPSGNEKRFFWLHRRRVFNPREQCWMGWERKRGKLHELNRLLRGATDTTFINPPLLPNGVHYVITLDADTRLPRGAASKLIGKLAHPLNQPRLDPRQQRVVEGYAILQPRVTQSLPMSGSGSTYQRLCSAPGGIEPYAAAISDLYQDLVGEGSYAGKGIYHIDAFEASLTGRIPDNSLLSHDMFEGVYARAGLASDIEVIEDFPNRYDVVAKRQHRWVRGDWQLLPWLLNGALPPIGRLKALGNLRRSLLPPLLLACLAVSWQLPLLMAAASTLMVILFMSAPVLLSLWATFIPLQPSVNLRHHFQQWLAELRLGVKQTLVQLIFLPDQAWRMLSAIGCTLTRLFVTHRHLLEWTSAAQTMKHPHLSTLGFYQHMAPGTALGAAVALVALGFNSSVWVIVLPITLLWLAAPKVAAWLSSATSAANHPLPAEETAQALRLIARQTWRYFETFVNSDNHYLPPDNFQEAPQPVTAQRTSPTNMGLYLLATVAARDFGWIGSQEALHRLTSTLAVMQTLPRFRGHFYNWYATADLRPLDPRYVSTVDSGNLAGHLITLANACDTWQETGAPNSRQGVSDTLMLAVEALARLSSEHEPSTLQPLQKQLEQIEALLEGDSTAPLPINDLLPLTATTVESARALLAPPADHDTETALFWISAVHNAVTQHSDDQTKAALSASTCSANTCSANTSPAQLQQLAHQARRLATSMDFAFLLNTERQLLSIGYSLDDYCLDSSCYDLLASEARLASLFAIAKGDVSTRHWFRLGRAATPLARGAALISWSGSMFEYLMPSLVMRAPAGSLLEQTNRLVVKRQQAYAAQLSAPWGISESGYNARDIEHTYQYSNFGVPGLGLKRGLSADLVVAPYATGLATMIDPESAYQNYRRLAEMGVQGRYGFYEAIDLTRSRLPAGEEGVIVRSYMAHHQGMTIVAIANTLQQGKMRARFHREPMIQASELLLQERIPRDVAIAYPRAEEVKSTASQVTNDVQAVRRVPTTVSGPPVTHLLSNGHYSVMLTATGGGYSRWHHIAITHWHPDTTSSPWGSAIFLRDTRHPGIWSATGQTAEHQSSANNAANHALFAEDYARYTHRHDDISSHLDVLVSGEDDSEVRLLSLTNNGRHTSDIDVTSYAELVLTTPAADNAHPCFAKMFVVTEYLSELNVLIATRRQRDPSEAPVWVAHFAVVEGDTVGEMQYETSRDTFIGRGRSLFNATALAEGQRLTGTVGSVLDPILALRYCLRVTPGSSARIAFWTVVAASREALMDLIDQHHDRSAFERAKLLAWTQAQVQLRHLGIQPDEAADFQRLAAPLLYPDARFRAPPSAIKRGAGPQSLLWQHGISGDLPIVLLRIDSLMDIAQLHQLLRAHEYWRMKRLEVDIVVMNERSSSYVQDLQQAIEATILSSQARPRLHEGQTQGAVFALRADLTSLGSRTQLQSIARIDLIASRGAIADQLLMVLQEKKAPNVGVSTKRSLPQPRTFKEPRPVTSPSELEFFNGLGGFAKQGKEYVTLLDDYRTTPAPWINVIANQRFGCQVSAEGAGYVWADNSKENQLTPWSNDPVVDPSGDAIYIRDEESLALYTATASPLRDAGRYVARHGFGYSQFEHRADGLDVTLLHLVPLEAPLRVSRLRITNHTNRVRKLSVTAYAEWVLGTSRSASAPFLITAQEAGSGALLATNPWNAAFPDRVAFLDIGEPPTSWTANRSEFIGYGKGLADPAGLRSKRPLSGAIGAGFDPCAALQRKCSLAPGETADIVVLLGQGDTTEHVQALIARYRDADIDDELAALQRHWANQLSAIQVTTPDRAMDIMLNGWLLYQTIACRLTARSAFYQASGAYGFRDQLQDGMALTFSQPATTRQHLLRAASRQFPEGDVQHWWLPHSGQGVRTRISDDRVWLAYACARYIETSQDRDVLNEPVSFLSGALLEPQEQEHFFLPSVSQETATLYEHCARGLDISLAQLGEHGLPLMGSGDWNDGMNRVGAKGCGESVWLGWLLIKALDLFIPYAQQHETMHPQLPNSEHRAARWQQQASGLRAALEQSAWDGQWYRRATYDDGTWLGSQQSDACQIDSIAQSWAVLSEAANPERAALAMASLERQLVRHDQQLALLFWPPFDQPQRDPGYISGYPPGMRENGGQYSHAAMWATLAFAKLGEGDSAHQLFSLLNPINHALTAEGAARYRVEPYVVAADVYSVPPHEGRGGWTWYTGAAGWMYQAGMEGILGIRREGNWLVIAPCLPSAWPSFSATVNLENTCYRITVSHFQTASEAPKADISATLDGTALTVPSGQHLRVPLDGQDHQLEVYLSQPNRRQPIP